MKGRNWLYILIVVIVLGGGSIIYGGTATELDAAKVQNGSISIQVEDTAIVQSSEDYSVFTAQNARITDISVETGQSVENGELIMQLENPELDLQLTENNSQLAQAKSALTAAYAGINRLQLQLKNARSDQTRMEELFNQGAVSKSEYQKAVLLVDSTEQALNEQISYRDTAESQINGLQSSVNKLINLKDELQIYSPIHGVILDLPVKDEQPVMAGTHLLTIGSAESLEIKADVLSDDLAEVKCGQSVFITAPVLGNTILEGTVSKIYPLAEEKMSALGVIQRRVPIIISLENSANLKPGYEVRVAIETDHVENVTTVPVESVRSKQDGTQEVMLIKNNRIVYLQVETGLSDNRSVEIKSDITEGAVIVRDASLNLTNNQKVKPLK